MMSSSNLTDVPQHIIGSTKPHSGDSTTSHPAKSSQHIVNDSHNNVGMSSNDKKLATHGIVHKSLLQSDALYQYVLETSVYPRENPYQRELREITDKHPWNVMSIPPEEGQFLMLLMKLINAKNTMELGVYTGYSLLSTALALPDDGKIIAMDMDRETYEVAGGAVIEKAGLSHKVDFREGLILPQLDEMLLQEENLGFFDFVFVDADKESYTDYHERLMKLVKVGGVICYDNTLWFGSVANPEDASYPSLICYFRPFVLEINRVLAADKRIEISQVPVGDGITLCRRIK